MGRSDESARDAQRLHALKAKVDSMIANNARLNEFRSQIRTEITHDGLMIQIVHRILFPRPEGRHRPIACIVLAFQYSTRLCGKKEFLCFA